MEARRAGRLGPRLTLIYPQSLLTPTGRISSYAVAPAAQRSQDTSDQLTGKLSSWNRRGCVRSSYREGGYEALEPRSRRPSPPLPPGRLPDSSDHPPAPSGSDRASGQLAHVVVVGAQGSLQGVTGIGHRQRASKRLGSSCTWRPMPARGAASLTMCSIEPVRSLIPLALDPMQADEDPVAGAVGERPCSTKRLSRRWTPGLTGTNRSPRLPP
jgi:hypothetical protein